MHLLLRTVATALEAVARNRRVGLRALMTVVLCYYFNVVKFGKTVAMQEGTFDIMQVCMSGHRINASVRPYQEFNKAFCPDCGEPTIVACPTCEAPIKGRYKGRDPFGLPSQPPPVRLFCESCGTAYPWQVCREANALELLSLEGVEEADVQEIKENLPDITRDTPRTQAATHRVLKALGKVGKPVFHKCVDVTGDIAAATAKSYLGV